MTILEMLLHELGLTQHEFDCERARFLLSPREWMEARLAKLGYVHVGDGRELELPFKEATR